MATLNIQIVVLDTHDINTIAIADASSYPNVPPVTVNPTLTIQAPGYNSVITPFNVLGFHILTSDMMGITASGIRTALPDGVYTFTYSEGTASSKISYMRVDVLLEKYYTVFMNLDMMECNQAIKTQAKVELNTVYLLIQGSIAAASNCAIITANELYDQADKMLNRMASHNCGCTGSNYIINYK